MAIFPPPPPKPPEDGIPKPKKLSEVPRYLRRRATGFFSRLFYIISLVWEAAPAVLLLLMFLCVADGLLPIAGAYISRALLNEIAARIGITGADAVWETFRPIIFLFFLEFIYLFLKKVFTQLDRTVTAIAGELVTNHIRLKIIDKAKGVDLSSFDRPEFYEKLENANREAGVRPIGILSATFSVISSVISAVSFIVVLATLSPLAPILILLASVPGAIITCLYRNRNFRYLRRHSKERRQMNYYSGILVNKDLAKEVKILDLGDTFTDKYRSVFARYYAGLKRLICREGISTMLVGLLSVAVHCLLFFFVAYRVVRGEGQIGDYTLYTGALSSIAGYVTTLVSSTAKIYEGTLFIDNMISFMKEESDIVPNTATPLLPAAGCAHTLELSHVSFRYPGADRDVLSDVSLTLRSGEHAVLVGLNGAGKTTLIKLLTRLYDPTEGVILLDGKDIRSYDVKAYHNLFGIIFQDFGKYAENATENIRFGDVMTPEDGERIHAAAEASDADSFLQKLPEGYDTPLTRMFEEDGIELSGGQWQKLSVARAFYKKGDILILDEPTASLDPLAEQAVFRRFEELSAGKIAVYVSHRLSSAVTASKIVLLDGGRVAECGTHEELMRLGGKYATLFSVQAERYGVGGDAARYASRYFAEAEAKESEEK